MRKIESLFALILVIALMTALVACTGNSKENETGEPAKAGEKAEITYWEMSWGPADTYAPTVEKLVEKFNDENPDVKVTVQMTPWDNFYQTFLTAITSGAAPDVSTGAFPQAIQYAQMDEILFLDSIIEEWEEENNPILDDFMPGSLDLEKYDGKQAAIPWNSDPRAIVYRKDYFEQAGITKDPETWDEFLDACRAIKEKVPGVVPFVFAAADQMSTQTMMNFMFSNGVGITDKDMNPSFEDPKMIEVLEFVSTLAKEGLVPEGINSYKGADAEKLYFSGKAAMWFNGPPASIIDYPEVDKASGILNPMAGPSGTKQNFTWLNAMMAYKQSKSPDAAKRFIKWWSENNLPLWTEGNAGPMPARLSYMDDPYFTDNWVKKEFGEKIMPNAVPPVWPVESLYPAFSQIEGENYPGLAIQDALGGETDFEAIGKKVNDMVKKAFEE